jgi:hypothetical protein
MWLMPSKHWSVRPSGDPVAFDKNAIGGHSPQSLDLALGEIAPFNCQVYDGWCAFLGCRFLADKPCL